MSEIVDLDCSQRDRYREFRLEDLSVDTVVDTRTEDDGRGVVTRFPAAVSGDWTNRELASIYRALRLLHGAGVAIEAERGVTDDGSPWCVFCNGQGEVLVHIARIDQGYVLDGVGLETTLRGRTFDELIDRFVRPHGDPGAAEQPAALSEILTLSRRREGKLFVHPAAQFAALLWAAMVVKDMAAAQEIDASRGTHGPDTAPLGDDMADDGAAMADRPRLAERADILTPDLTAKLRDAGHANVLQSAGLMSLAYFLVSSDQMSPGAVLERHVAEFGPDLDVAAPLVEAASALTVFAQALQAIGNVLQTLGDIFQMDTPQVAEDTNPAELSPTAEATLSMLAQIETMLEARIEANLAEEPQIALDPDLPRPPQEALSAERAPAPVPTDEAMASFDDILEYLHSVAASMAPRFSPPPAGIFALIEDGAGTEPGALQPTEPRLPPAEEARTTDGEIIAAILDFLREADEALSYYQTAGVHVIEQGDRLTDGEGTAHTFTWTFDDGSRILLVGTAEDLAGFGGFS